MDGGDWREGPSNVVGDIQETSLPSGNATPYDYAALPTDFDTPSFRLLCLKPASAHEPIVAELITSTIENAPKYIGLSYSWGPPVYTRTIWLEVGQNLFEFKVTPTLERALGHLRAAPLTPYIWVDFICINQNDLHERGAQVSLMGLIFSQALIVGIWLDDYDSASVWDEPGDWLQLLEDACALPRAWMKRLWVVQEVLCAKYCPMVMLGSYREGLQAFLSRWSKALPSEGLPGNIPWALPEGRANNILIPQQMQRPGSQVNRTGYLAVESLYQAWRKCKHDGRRKPLLNRLRENSYRESSDPHDRIYALLGVSLEHEQERFPPQYEMPIAELKRDVARYLKETTRVDDSELVWLFRHSPIGNVYFPGMSSPSSVTAASPAVQMSWVHYRTTM